MRGWNFFDARRGPFPWGMFFFPFLLPFHRNCLLKGTSPLSPLLLPPSVFFLPNPSNYLSNTNGIIQSFPGSKYSGREGEYLSNTNGIIQSYAACKYSGRNKENQKTERKIKSPMRLALANGHVEAAKILARKGADCTEAEKQALGEKYTNFQQIQQREAQARQGQARAEQEEESKSKKE